MRERYDTRRKTHPVGEGVFVIKLAELPQFLAQTARVSATYKLQPFILQHELDMAQVPAVPVALQFRARKPLYPINLRVNGDGVNPTYASGEGVTLDWDGTDARRTLEGPTATLSTDLDSTLIQILTTGGVSNGTLVFPRQGPQGLSNAQIIGLLGAETDFVVRAWFQASGRTSSESDSITVRKV